MFSYTIQGFLPDCPSYPGSDDLLSGRVSGFWINACDDQPMNFNEMMFDAVSNVYTSINSRSSCWNSPQRCQICLARITSNAEYLSVQYRHHSTNLCGILHHHICQSVCTRRLSFIHSENITIIITRCILYAIVIFEHALPVIAQQCLSSSVESGSTPSVTRSVRILLFAVTVSPM